MSLFTERIAFKPFEYPEYYTEGWLKQAQAFWLHTEISMQGDVKDWKENILPKLKKFCSRSIKLISNKPSERGKKIKSPSLGYG